jgi:hypothetical protein
MAISETVIDSPAVFPAMEYAIGQPATRPYNGIHAALVVQASLPHPLPEDSLEFRFSEMDLVIPGSLFEVSGLGNGAGLLARGVVGQDVALELSVKGSDISAAIRPTERSAHAEFVASTIIALLGLSGRGTVTIALGKRLFRWGKSNLALKTKSRVLQWRDLAYKLLVIERAAQANFELPDGYSGIEIQKINFLFQAMVRRSFIWPLNRYPLRLNATPEDLRRIKARGSKTPIKFLRPRVSETLFGREIYVGDMSVLIRQPAVLNLNQLLKELAAGDGHQVLAWLAPFDGTAKISTTQAPQLAAGVWGEDERSLIALDPFLTSALGNEYNSLAAATLEGLSDEEKAEITTRPEIGMSSFYIQTSQKRHS